MTLDWAAKLREIITNAEPIPAETPFVSGTAIVYETETFVSNEMISELARIIRQPDIQTIGRALRNHVYESNFLTDLRKEIQTLQVKLNRAKLSKNKQEIRKLEDELNFAIGTFSQTKMFETLASEPTRQVQIKKDPFLFDGDYLKHWYPRHQ